MSQQQFENFTASSLYCEKCKAAMPVRERLLLVLPDKEIFDYLCTGCASSVGQREVTAGEKLMAQACRRVARAGALRRADASSSSARCALSSSARARSACRLCARCSISPEHELVGVVTQPDKPVGREQRIQAPPIKTALAGSALPILQPARIKREEAVAEIRALAPDVIVVMAYGQILPRAVLEIPRIACLNLHASLLPRYRGAAPIQAAIAAGDQETGITVMYMDEGLDTGDILLQNAICRSRLDETGGSLHDRLGGIAPAALLEALAQLQPETRRACSRMRRWPPMRRNWSASTAGSIGRNRRR